MGKALLYLTLLWVSTISVDAQRLPWKIEKPLKEFAKESYIKKPLHPTSPQPDEGAWPHGPSLQILNPAIRSTIWGPTNKITVSLIKNDVWDRRITPKKYQAPTLQEITEGAFAAVNNEFSDLNTVSTRPQWGYLKKEGGKFNPYLDLTRYPFPMLKKVGQMIWMTDEFAEAKQPEVSQLMSNAKTEVVLEKDGKKGKIEYVLGMKRNTYAMRTVWQGVKQPITFRLYRNKDTGYLKYMTEDGKSYLSGSDKLKVQRLKEYQADSLWNEPLPAPTVGIAGHFCWVRQQLPAEKTFPKGFEYVMMAYIPDIKKGKIESSVAQQNLGTKTPIKEINEAKGSAVSWVFTPEEAQSSEVYVTIVTTLDAKGKNIMALARKELLTVAKKGFDGILTENESWYADFYDKRENGRVFYGTPDETKATEDMKNVYYSWFCEHDGATNTNMQQLQASAHYVVPELDIQPYSGLPCYNEIFYTPYSVRNRDDQVKMWKQLVKQWAPASRVNAKEMFDMPGMYITHGFLPPIKPDKYVHTNVALELSVETMAQILKPWWDEWDYSGNIKVLEELYPYLKDMALFYAAYAKKGEDGIYHIIPSMQEESFGIQPKFSHSRDCIAAICMFKWAFERTAEAAKILNKDAVLAKKWLQIAKKLPTYPTWEKPLGKIYSALTGIEPWRGKGEHGWYVGVYPTVLSDDINLDSEDSLKQIMIRTANFFPAALSQRTNILLGENSNLARGDQYLGSSLHKIEEPERLLNSRSGIIHVFPCLRDTKDTIAFRNFQARGGFWVSACYDGTDVSFLEINARKNGICSLINPWNAKKVKIIENKTGKEIPYQINVTKVNNIQFNAQKGETYSFLAE